jgi:hypothetical protein
MSAEISLTIVATCRNGTAPYQLYTTFAPGTVTIDQATKGAERTVFLRTTSDVALSLSSLTSLGLTAFKNLDTTNYVDIGPDSAGAIVPFIRLKAGEVAILRLKPGITWRTQANTASVRLEVWGLDA